MCKEGGTGGVGCIDGAGGSSGRGNIGEGGGIVNGRSTRLHFSLKGAAERILRGAVRGVQRCRELHRQACTRAGREAVPSSVERRRAVKEVLHCPGCRMVREVPV